jgi:hypothetical protein
MKIKLCTFGLLPLLFSCLGTSSKTELYNESRELLPDPEGYKKDTFIVSQHIAGQPFTLGDAEKIMGEPAHLTDSVNSNKGSYRLYRSGYKANEEDPKTKKTGAVYFLIEQFGHDSMAHNKYAAIKKANDGHNGIRVANDIGNEAYFHSDGQNFYFVMARKGNKVFNMKVNKITSKTSQETFNDIARRIATEL